MQFNSVPQTSVSLASISSVSRLKLQVIAITRGTGSVQTVGGMHNVHIFPIEMVVLYLSRTEK